jgi:hypothetical protein
MQIFTGCLSSVNWVTLKDCIILLIYQRRLIIRLLQARLALVSDFMLSFS